MAFLVRKLIKRSSIDLIADADSLENMFADAATSEFRTTKGTLSTWRINDIDDLDNAVLAIVVTSSKIERMDFIVIDTTLIEENHLEYIQSDAGKEIAVPDLQNTHYNIVNVTISKLINCACIYRKVFEQDDDNGIYIVRYAQGDIKDLLEKAVTNGRIRIELLTKDIRKTMNL